MKIKLLTPTATKPYQATSGSAGHDLRSDSPDLFIKPGETVMVRTGVAIHIGNENSMGLLVPRSSLGYRGLVLANTVGIIDSDYQGEIMIMLKNVNHHEIALRHGERIAQLVFVKISSPTFLKVEEFSDETERGKGGFGSTGN